tara:strand:- start:930 stop:2012 length:1083 start_codon:yes stop_codon:yes gene_type:complete
MNNSLNEPIIEPKELLNAKYVFIDGISRSGKAAIAPIISSIPNFEHFKTNYNLDRILFLFETNKITKDAFRYFLETDLIMDTWFTMIGRNQNTNKHDVSSIVNSPNFHKYKKRENKKDNKKVFEELSSELKENNIIFPYLTDEFIFQKKLIKEIVPNAQFIITIRNPIELIFAWERSGRGVRYGKDIRMLHPTFSKNKFKNIPYFAIENPEKYSNYNSIERCVYSVIKLQSQYYDLFEEDSKDFYCIDFEKYVQDPTSDLNNLSKFLDLNHVKWNEDILKQARIPRELELDLHKLKTRLVFSGINEELKKELLKLSLRHIKLFGNHYNANYNKLSLQYKKIVDFNKVTNEPKYKNGWRIN